MVAFLLKYVTNAKKKLPVTLLRHNLTRAHKLKLRVKLPYLTLKVKCRHPSIFAFSFPQMALDVNLYWTKPACHLQEVYQISQSVTK